MFSLQELMSQRQKLAVEREKLQAELEHFRKCLTLPQTPHWPRGSHYKGYPPRWPRHAQQMAPRSAATYPFWPTPRVYFPRLGPHGSSEETGWLHEMNEQMVKDGQSLGRSPPQTVPRPTSTCQCSHPAPPTRQDQQEYGAGRRTRTRTHLLFTVFSPCCSYVRSLPPSPPQTHRQSCQWGSSYPRRGVAKGPERSESFWPGWTDIYGSGHELLNWKCT